MTGVRSSSGTVLAGDGGDGRQPGEAGQRPSGDDGARLGRQVDGALPLQVRPVHEHGADGRLQLREGEGDAGQGEGRQLHDLGRGRAGQSAAAVALLHALHRRHRVRRRQRRLRAYGRGEDGAAARRAHARDSRRAGTGARQQAGPAGRARRGPSREADVPAGDRRRTHVDRPAGLRRYGRRARRSARGALPDDPEAAQDRQDDEETTVMAGRHRPRRPPPAPPVTRTDRGGCIVQNAVPIRKWYVHSQLGPVPVCGRRTGDVVRFTLPLHRHILHVYFVIMLDNYYSINLDDDCLDYNVFLIISNAAHTNVRPLIDKTDCKIQAISS